MTSYSTSRQIEPIERALEQMFARVLHHCEDEPPQLREVRVDYDNMRQCLQIRAEFNQEGRQPLYHALTISGHDLPRDVRGGGSRRFLYDAGVLWSRMYEDHYVRRIQQSGMEAARRAYESGDFVRGHQLQEIADRTAEHARAFHVDRASGPDRTAYHHEYRSYPSELIGPPSARTTATEVRARQRAHERNFEITHRQIAAQFERQLMRGFEVSGETTTSTEASGTNATGITVEHLRSAMRALEQNSVAPEWRHAFERGSFEVYENEAYRRALHETSIYGSSMWFTPNPEVGSPEAQARGIELLKESLTPEQRESYEKNKYFEVQGSDTGTRYRIKHGRQMNIDVLDEDGKRKSGICFLPIGGLVAGDCMLAQKCALELEENEALKVANRFGERGMADAEVRARVQI